MAVEEQLLYGPELPENYFDAYTLSDGPYDPIAEWRLQQNAENDRMLAQMKEGTALEHINDPGRSIRRYTPPQSGGLADVRINTHASSTDVTPADANTGAISTLNTSVSGRAGHAKIYLAYNTGAGSTAISAYNQFWPVIITLT